MPNQTYEVFISPRAKQMLGSHFRYLSQVSPDAAKKMKAKLIQAIASLQTMPQRFPFFQDLYIPANKYRKMYVKERYIVLYQIQDQNVFVDYVLDCREDYEHGAKSP